MANSVYIGTSLDGYIADKDGGLDWLMSTPNPDNDDFGFAEFMARVDAIIMGRNTFETVCSFGGDWPYNKPVFVLSSTLTTIPIEYTDNAQLISGTPGEVVTELNRRGFIDLYIDGGITIQKFLQADLIDELIISQLPIVLGGGTPLFGELAEPLMFKHRSSEVLLNAIVKSHYRRNR